MSLSNRPREINVQALYAISPIDGRYHSKTEQLSGYFSEYALMKYRILIEIEYLIALAEGPLADRLQDVHAADDNLREIYNNFDEQVAVRIKEIEQVTNHDVKAVEYYIKEQMDVRGLEQYTEYVHFGLTSQDINNTALPLLLHDFHTGLLLVRVEELSGKLLNFGEKWLSVPMLARTHGQAATPVTVGSAMLVFQHRLAIQALLLRKFIFKAKFGGATGGFNAHQAAFPISSYFWVFWADDFINSFGLQREHWTTQISNYDNLAEYLQLCSRICGILINLCRDIWSYISLGYFKQLVVAGETGSSTMPHKVNPIRFENAEGNLGIAQALFGWLAEKLPVSRLQRDLTDSTITRNLGVPFAHLLLAVDNIREGINGIEPDQFAIISDLDCHPQVITEAYQTILRREGVPKPYEQLKEYCRGKNVTLSTLHSFVDSLILPERVVKELKALTPQNYRGVYPS